MKYLRMGIGYIGDTVSGGDFGAQSISWNMLDGDFILLRQNNITYSHQTNGTKYFGCFGEAIGYVDLYGWDQYQSSLVWKIMCRQKNHDVNAQPYLEISLAHREDHPLSPDNLTCEGNVFIHYADRHNLRYVIHRDVFSEVKKYEFFEELIKAPFTVPEFFQLDWLPWRFFVANETSSSPHGLIEQLPMYGGPLPNQNVYEKYYTGDSWAAQTVIPSSFLDAQYLYYDIPADMNAGIREASYRTSGVVSQFLAGSIMHNDRRSVPDTGAHSKLASNYPQWAGPVLNFNIIDKYKPNYLYDSILTIVAGSTSKYAMTRSGIRGNITGWDIPTHMVNGDASSPINIEGGLDTNCIKPYRGTPFGLTGRRNASAVTFEVSDCRLGRYDEEPLTTEEYLDFLFTRKNANNLIEEENIFNIGQVFEQNIGMMLPFIIHSIEDYDFMFDCACDRYGTGFSNRSLPILGDAQSWWGVGPAFTLGCGPLDYNVRGETWYDIDHEEYADQLHPGMYYTNFGTVGIKVVTMESNSNPATIASSHRAIPTTNPSNENFGKYIDCYIVPSLTCPQPALDIYGLRYGEEEPFIVGTNTTTSNFAVYPYTDESDYINRDNEKVTIYSTARRAGLGIIG